MTHPLPTKISPIQAGMVFAKPSGSTVQHFVFFWHIVQGIYEIFKADLKLSATELLLSPNGRYKCPKQRTKSTKKSHWWNMLKFRFENLSNLPQGDHVLKMETIQKFSSLGTFCL